MINPVTPPKLNAVSLSTYDLCRLYRAIDAIEEVSNMAELSVMQIQGDNAPAAAYLARLQEWLGGERMAVVEALRDRPNTEDPEGSFRISTILQYEAWCQEFLKSTIDQFSNSGLAREAFP